SPTKLAAYIRQHTDESFAVLNVPQPQYNEGVVDISIHYDCASFFYSDGDEIFDLPVQDPFVPFLDNEETREELPIESSRLSWMEVSLQADNEDPKFELEVDFDTPLDFSSAFQSMYFSPPGLESLIQLGDLSQAQETSFHLADIDSLHDVDQEFPESVP